MPQATKKGNSYFHRGSYPDTKMRVESLFLCIYFPFNIKHEIPHLPHRETLKSWNLNLPTNILVFYLKTS
ncbi:hypothetical protein DRF57_05550 [Chryseobacterium rhizosphaerae]|uniref:Uncharacterized protein n=1 Tax=Chryseobacterium rhizosphaerae TaxID=395937 RepID=A0ABX9IP20_9FLAO|nr:hypothetical protein DRF57_05550 [Chryseobacterium rhizosphaerae]